MSLKTVLFMILFLKIYGLQTQDFGFDQSATDKCELHETCNKCIEELNCNWCASETSTVRCRSTLTNDLNWCSNDYIINPKSTQQIVENSTNFQVYPQKIKLKLRRGEQYNIEFNYVQTRDYPTDLYFLMDMSASMKIHKDKLAKLGGHLAETMKKLTKNFQLGFGSFVDKVELPFVNTNPVALQNPCATEKCETPYSYKHHLSLTNNSEHFVTKVNETKPSGNIDAPEGGLDALMQAMVCGPDIGWRKNARRILVFSSDTHFHIAGDGKLAGVIKPNDANCHMENGEYIASLIYDYPSISQINYVAKERNINIIFAIVENKISHEAYEILSSQIENSKLGFLSGDGGNVVQLIVDNYNKIVDSVIIQHNATEDVSVKIFSNCKNKLESGCTNVHVGETVKFTATIQPLQCTSDTNKYIRISPRGLEESLLVELEVLCDCGCFNNPNLHKINASECNEHGDLECGVCSCHKGRFGQDCRCDSSTSTTEDTAGCTFNNQICSGQGSCYCGSCVCNVLTDPSEVISGKYCQCNNYTCPKDKKLNICSGHGMCKCGQCECYPDYTDSDCSCHNITSSCIAPGTSSICSGNGECKCGRCECSQDGEKKYTGTYCAECQSCPAQRCDELRPCVMLNVSSSENNEECKLNNTQYEIILADPPGDGKNCTVIDKEGCTISYQYIDNETLTITVQKGCPARLTPEEIRRNNIKWIIGVIGSILGAGLIALIVWKVCTTVHDKREYAKFEKERAANKWNRNDNPLYKEATSTFANPSYNRMSRRL